MSKADRAALLTSAINELVTQHSSGDLGKPFADVPTSGRGDMKDLITTTVHRIANKKTWRARLETNTRPWSHDEYLYLNGIPHVYSVNPEIGTIVHMRGGGSISMRDAWVNRYQITTPIRLRIDDLYDRNLAKLIGEAEAAADAAE